MAHVGQEGRLHATGFLGLDLGPDEVRDIDEGFDAPGDGSAVVAQGRGVLEDGHAPAVAGEDVRLAFLHGGVAGTGGTGRGGRFAQEFGASPSQGLVPAVAGDGREFVVDGDNLVVPVDDADGRAGDGDDLFEEALFPLDRQPGLDQRGDIEQRNDEPRENALLGDRLQLDREVAIAHAVAERNRRVGHPPAEQVEEGPGLVVLGFQTQLRQPAAEDVFPGPAEHGQIAVVDFDDGAVRIDKGDALVQGVDDGGETPDAAGQGAGRRGGEAQAAPGRLLRGSDSMPPR